MKTVITLLVFTILAVPTVLFAALVPVACDNPRTCGTCEFASGINNVIQFIVQISVLLAVMVFMYAGFLMVTSAGNTGQLEKAKGLFFNVVIGLIILLSAFLIVNTFLVGFLKTDSPVYNWQNIQCVYPTADSGGLLSTDFSNNESVTLGDGVVGSPSVPGGYSGPLSQCYSGNIACSVSALQAAGLTEQQANIMSCIAMTESSGIANTPPYNETNPGSNSSACGTFQITRTTWNNYRPSGSCSDWRSNCQNASCNIQVARTLVQQNGYSDWTCPNCNSKAQGCVSKYSSG